jgi:cbb3-type cytochrome oxidase cytochrome c subunit
MKKAWMTAMALAVAVAFCGTAKAEEAKEPAGKTLFLSNSCNTCHSISAAGIEKKVAKTEAAATEKKEAAPAGEKVATAPSHKPPDLSGVGLDQKPDWMAKFLKKEVMAKDGKKHMKLWKGTDADLATLTAWLGEQKAETKAEEKAEKKAEDKAEDKAEKAEKAAAPETKAPETTAPETKTPETTK